VNRLALDIGKARIGIASSYSTLASNYQTLFCKSWTKDTNQIAEIVKNFGAEEVIVGLPLNMDGTESEMCIYVKGFCNMLKTKISAKIIFVDERLTSVDAEHIMHQNNVKTSKKKGLIDQIAATLILQTYLDGVK
jgi:putative Holliday junction resolvase